MNEPSSSDPPASQRGSLVKVFPDLDALSLAASETVKRLAGQAVESRGRCSLVLSGGSTPTPLYRILASLAPHAMPWGKMHLFWSDERFVPPDHPNSNFGTAQDVLLRHIPIPLEHIHPISTSHRTPRKCAEAYEGVLRKYFGERGRPQFDIVLLGMGADGHTASVFPGDTSSRGEGDIGEERWVLAVEAPPAYSTANRITLSLESLNRAESVLFLVSGCEKMEALRTVLSGAEARLALPAARVRAAGRLMWFVDRDAHGGDPLPVAYVDGAE